MEPAAAKAAAEYLIKGCPPPDDEALLRASAGISFLTDFLRGQYLEDYIPSGGSKIKFVTGRSGSGKTHFGRLIRKDDDVKALRVTEPVADLVNDQGISVMQCVLHGLAVHIRTLRHKNDEEKCHRKDDGERAERRR